MNTIILTHLSLNQDCVPIQRINAREEPFLDLNTCNVTLYGSNVWSNLIIKKIWQIDIFKWKMAKSWIQLF